MEEKTCKTCRHAYLAGYRQIICDKTNQWESENCSCERWEEAE